MLADAREGPATTASVQQGVVADRLPSGRLLKQQRPSFAASSSPRQREGAPAGMQTIAKVGLVPFTDRDLLADLLDARAAFLKRRPSSARPTAPAQRVSAPPRRPNTAPINRQEEVTVYTATDSGICRERAETAVAAWTWGAVVAGTEDSCPAAFPPTSSDTAWRTRGLPRPSALHTGTTGSPWPRPRSAAGAAGPRTPREARARLGRDRHECAAVRGHCAGTAIPTAGVRRPLSSVVVKPPCASGQPDQIGAMGRKRVDAGRYWARPQPERYPRSKTRIPLAVTRQLVDSGRFM